MENAKKRRKTLLFHLPADMAPVAAKIKTLCAGEVTDSETGEDFAFIRRFPGSRLFALLRNLPNLKSILT